MNLISSFFSGLSPIEKLTCDKWADKNRYLTTESSAEPGLWNTERTPFLREILEGLSPTSPINEVIVAKGVQLGFTESGLNCVGTYIDIDPCPIMYVMPTIDMAEALSKDRVAPMIENCASLRKKVLPSKSRDSGNTIRVKKFPGGRLILSGANSAPSLRSRPCRVLIFDEVDAAPLDVEGEGSPISLAEKRTSTFGDTRKIYKLSTPTTAGKSVIWKEYEATDQRKFHLPCPHCGLMQELVFERLKWSKDDYESISYQCAGCEEMIPEKFKTQMLSAGRWIATAPQTDPRRVGYHINSLYSPVGWLSWASIARMYDKAENDNDDNLRKTFVNTILGLCYEEVGEAPDWEKIYNRRDSYTIGIPPKEVAFITVGADVQKNRIEYEVVGWGKGKRSWSIDYGVIMGDTAGEDVWNQLGEVVSKTWTREDGVVLPMRKMCVDSGHNTQHVYNFCRKFDPTKVCAIKGQDKQPTMISNPKSVDVDYNGKRVGNVLLWNIGVSVIKHELYGWLRLEIDHEKDTVPAGYCRFPEYGYEYFKGLTAERLLTRVVNGRSETVWDKYYQRNEPLDCRVYARAGAAMLQMDRFSDRDYELIAGTATAKKKKEKKEEDSWL